MLDLRISCLGKKMCVFGYVLGTEQWVGPDSTLYVE